MSVTHAAIAICTTSIALGSADGFILATALIGSQFPDLDKTDSYIGKVLYPIARYLEDRYPHRTITHSFASSGVLAIATLPILFWLHWHWWAALNLGHFCGWFADCFTKAGTAAFFPSTARLVIPGNPRARLTSGSTWEYWVLAIAFFLAATSINLASAGGISEQFARGFFQDVGTASKLYQQYGSSQIIIARVEGMHRYTQQAISSRYTILDASATDLLGQEELTGKLYKIGNSPDSQIQPNKVKVEYGDRLNITAQEVTLKDIAVSDWVLRLPQSSYISGSLLVEDSTDLQMAPSLEEFNTIRMWGGQLELQNARPSQIASQLGEFWILDGKAIIKERTR